jgi:hypothetical protein
MRIKAGLPEISMAVAAPKPAAEETPRMSGLTRGLRNIPWKDAPLMDNAPPTHIARIALGSLTWRITRASVSIHVWLIGRRLENSIFIQFIGETEYLPIKSDARNNKISRTTRKDSIFTGLRVFLRMFRGDPV